MASKKDIRNLDVRDALIALGLIPPQTDVDLAGAQNGFFKNGLAGKFGITDEQFDAAKTLARWDGNPDDTGDISKAAAKAGVTLNTTGDAADLFHKFQNTQQTGHPEPAPPAPGAAPPPPGMTNEEFFGKDFKQGPTPPPLTLGTVKPPVSPNAPATPAPAKPAPAAPAPLTNTAEGGAVVKALPKNASDAQVEQYLKENYGSDTWVLQVPEIRDIIFKNLKNPSGVTQGIVNSAIQATPWWQQNGKNVADFLQQQATNGRGLNDEILKKQHQLDAKAAALGLTLSPERNLAIATDWQKWQWDDNAVNGALSGEFHYQNNQHTQFTDKMLSDAKSYVVPVSENTIQQWGQRIIANPNEQGNWLEFLKGQAKLMFPGMADRIDRNETVQDIAKPFAATAAQYLEMDENDVLNNLSDPKWMTALDQVDPKTGVHSTMPPADWVRKLKDDPQYRFDYTEQAKTAATGMATGLLKTFGAIR